MNSELQRAKARAHCLSMSKHSMSYTSTYKSWSGAKARCNNKSNKDFPRYGGRGIKFCKRWNKFENFLSDMGEKPARHSLDRIDNDGDYKPSNCRWATSRTQSRNKRSNRIITAFGISQPIQAWAEKFCLNKVTLLDRINRGWPVEIALQAPGGNRGYKLKHWKEVL